MEDISYLFLQINKINDSPKLLLIFPHLNNNMKLLILMAFWKPTTMNCIADGKKIKMIT